MCGVCISSAFLCLIIIFSHGKCLIIYKIKSKGCFSIGPGFCWDRVNFLPDSWYSAVFEIELMTHWYFGWCSVMLIPNQGLCSFPCSASVQVYKKLGGNTFRTADPQIDHRDVPYYNTPCSVYKLGAVGQQFLPHFLGSSCPECPGLVSRWSASVLCIILFL